MTLISSTAVHPFKKNNTINNNQSKKVGLGLTSKLASQFQYLDRAHFRYLLILNCKQVIQV